MQSRVSSIKYQCQLLHKLVMIIHIIR